MLPLPSLYASDRLSIVVMALLDAVGASITGLGLRRPDHDHAPALFFRLSAIIRAIIRLTLDGPRAKPKATTRKPAPDPAPPAPRRPSGHVPTPRLPPGWILDLLPDTAPAIAADLAALLADPACATLLALAPTLHRRLRPVLRALGLTPLPAPSPPPPAPPPSATPPSATPHPNPPPSLHAKPTFAASTSRTENSTLNLPYLHARFVTN